jgi:hypothetical protein
MATEAVRQHGQTNLILNTSPHTVASCAHVSPMWFVCAMICSERSGVKKSRKRRNQPAAKGDQGAASLAGMSEKEKAKIAALDKSDKKGSSLDATTGSAREGALLYLWFWAWLQSTQSIFQARFECWDVLVRQQPLNRTLRCHGACACGDRNWRRTA